MIYINRINNNFYNKKISFVICDFDRTLTTSDSSTSWSVIPSSDLVDPYLKKESNLIFNHYRPIELDKDISKENKAYNMKRWALEQINLYSRYNVTKELLYKILDSNNNMILRDGLDMFLYGLKKKGIRIYIVSAGIYDVINYTLDKNNLLLDNIQIISNHLVYNNNVISGVKGNLIHSCNKDSIKLDIDNNEYGLLFGDQVEDKMLGKNYNTFDIAFMDKNNECYDVVAPSNGSFKVFNKLLIKE